MSSSDRTHPVPEVIGRALAILIPSGLMLWAATETSGLLRWGLVGWVAFVVLISVVHSVAVTK